MLKLKTILTRIPCAGEPQKNTAKKDKRPTMPIRIIPTKKWSFAGKNQSVFKFEKGLFIFARDAESHPKESVCL